MRCRQHAWRRTAGQVEHGLPGDIWRQRRWRRATRRRPLQPGVHIGTPQLQLFLLAGLVDTLIVMQIATQFLLDWKPTAVRDACKLGLNYVRTGCRQEFALTDWWSTAVVCTLQAAPDKAK